MVADGAAIAGRVAVVALLLAAAAHAAADAPRFVDGSYRIRICNGECGSTGKDVTGLMVVDRSRRGFVTDDLAVREKTKAESRPRGPNYCYFFDPATANSADTMFENDIVGFGEISRQEDGRETVTFFNESPDFRLISTLVTTSADGFVGDWSNAYAGNGGSASTSASVTLVGERIGDADVAPCIAAVRVHENADGGGQLRFLDELVARNPEEAGRDDGLVLAVDPRATWRTLFDADTDAVQSVRLRQGDPAAAEVVLRDDEVAGEGGVPVARVTLGGGSYRYRLVLAGTTLTVAQVGEIFDWRDALTVPKWEGAFPRIDRAWTLQAGQPATLLVQSAGGRVVHTLYAMVDGRLKAVWSGPALRSPVPGADCSNDGSRQVLVHFDPVPVSGRSWPDIDVVARETPSCDGDDAPPPREFATTLRFDLDAGRYAGSLPELEALNTPPPVPSFPDGTYAIRLCSGDCAAGSRVIDGVLVVDGSRRAFSGQHEAMQFLMRADSGELAPNYCYVFDPETANSTGTLLEHDIVSFGESRRDEHGRQELAFLLDSPDFRFLSRVQTTHATGFVGDWSSYSAGDGGNHHEFADSHLLAERTGDADASVCFAAVRRHERLSLDAHCDEFDARTCEPGDRDGSSP